MINETGVAKSGQRLADRSNAPALLQAAGVTDTSEQKTITRVSAREGVFEAANTYDTGFVSVGFIQFTSGRRGNGSLATVLRNLKSNDAAQFAGAFHALGGVDVNERGIVVVDPANGNALEQPAAVQAIMDDKRLTAVFHDAGINSREFQAAQVRVARDTYYLAPRTFPATDRDGRADRHDHGRFQDVQRSEAGKTALMDRAVLHARATRRGRSPTPAGAIINQHAAGSVADLARYEVVITARLRNRVDVLQAADLTQPPAPPP